MLAVLGCLEHVMWSITAKSQIAEIQIDVAMARKCLGLFSE